MHKYTSGSCNVPIKIWSKRTIRSPKGKMLFTSTITQRPHPARMIQNFGNLLACSTQYSAARHIHLKLHQAIIKYLFFRSLQNALTEKTFFNDNQNQAFVEKKCSNQNLKEFYSKEVEELYDK